MNSKEKLCIISSKMKVNSTISNSKPNGLGLGLGLGLV